LLEIEFNYLRLLFWICVEELILTKNGDEFLGFSKLGLVPLFLCLLIEGRGEF